MTNFGPLQKLFIALKIGLSTFAYAFKTMDKYNQGSQFKVQWFNTPCYYIDGVAKYNVVAKNFQCSNPELMQCLSGLFEVQRQVCKVPVKDITGLNYSCLKKSGKKTADILDYEHFLEIEWEKKEEENLESVETLKLILNEAKNENQFNKPDTFIIYGWSEQLFFNNSDVSHRMSYAIQLAHKLAKENKQDTVIEDSIEIHTISEKGWKDFNKKYISYLVPAHLDGYMQRFLRSNGLTEYRFSKEKMPMCSALYILDKEQLPKGFFLNEFEYNELDQVFTNFNRLLKLQLQVQKTNPLLKKYLPASSTDLNEKTIDNYA